MNESMKKMQVSDEQYQELCKTHIVELGWNDPDKKDFLVIVSSKPFKDVMAANAKGTRVYELIDLYGGVDGVQKVFPGTASAYGDATDIPEMFSPEQLENMAHKLSEYAKAQKQAQAASSSAQSEEGKEVIKGENEQTGSTTEQEVK